MHARVENGTVTLYGAIPQHYVFPDGSYTGNFADMGAEVHKVEGFLPFEDNPPTYDPNAFTLEQEEYEVTEEVIRPIYKLVALSPETIVAHKTAAEQASLVAIHARCKQLLADTDRKWDAPNREEYTIYRQKLRDILHHCTDPSAVIWPEKPL